MNKKVFFKMWDLVWVFLSVAALVILGQLFLGNIEYFAQMDDESFGGAGFLVVYLIQTLIFAIPLLAMMKIRGIVIRDFGFKRVGWKNILKIAGLGYLAYISIMMVVMQITISYNIELPGFGQQESHMDFLGDQKVWAIVVIAIIAIIAPLIEEVFFRGFVFQTMLKAWPKWLAFIASAAVFAGIHLEFQVFMPLFLLGLVLNWMFYKSGSLYPGIFFHIVNNSIAIGLEYYIYLHPEVLDMYGAMIHFAQ